MEICETTLGRVIWLIPRDWVDSIFGFSMLKDFNDHCNLYTAVSRQVFDTLIPLNGLLITTLYRPPLACINTIYVSK